MKLTFTRMDHRKPHQIYLCRQVPYLMGKSRVVSIFNLSEDGKTCASANVFEVSPCRKEQVERILDPAFDLILANPDLKSVTVEL